MLPVNRLSKDYFGHLQVCAYKDGKVVIDTAAGVLGKYDPRPVQPDSLFPVFSVTKGITAGMVHWLVDKGYDSVCIVIYFREILQVIYFAVLHQIFSLFVIPL